MKRTDVQFASFPKIMREFPAWGEFEEVRYSFYVRSGERNPYGNMAYNSTYDVDTLRTEFKSAAMERGCNTLLTDPDDGYAFSCGKPHQTIHLYITENTETPDEAVVFIEFGQTTDEFENIAF